MKKQTKLGGKLSGNVLKKFSDLLILVLLGLVVFIAGCTKEYPVEPITSETILLQCDVKANNDTIPKGGTWTVVLTSNADSAFATLSSGENRKVTTSGNAQFVLYESTKIDFRFYKGIDTKTISISATVTIPVPKVHLSADFTHAHVGDIVVINITAYDYDYFTTDLPGVAGPGKYQIKLMEITTIYYAVVKNSVGTDSASLTIVATPPDPPPIPTPLMDIITSHPWSEVSGVRSCDGNDPWSPLTIGQEELDIKYVFHSDGKWEAYRYGILINWDTFSVNETDSTMIWGGGYNKIKILNETTLTLEHQELSFGCPGDSGYTKRTYSPAVLKK